MAQQASGPFARTSFGALHANASKQVPDLQFEFAVLMVDAFKTLPFQNSRNPV